MMKNYDEYSYDDIISYALNTFLVMSTDYFTYLISEIDLLEQINFTDELKSYARQFCEIAMPSIGQSTPNRKVSDDYFNKKELFEAWEYLFSYLRKSEYSKTILNWFNYLMRVEAYFAPKLTFSPWMDILLNWNKLKQIDKGPNLSQLINQQITILLLQERVRKFEWCCKPRLWLESDKDMWSRYVMKSASMWRVITHYGLLKMWIEIFKILKEEDLIELDKWGQYVFEKLNITDYFSLPQLKQDLKNHGYLE